MTRALQIAGNLAAVRDRIGQACARAGRDVASVQLIAVSKTRPIDDVRAALDAGQRAFGENYAQELDQKASALGTVLPEWHFLGALQTNKVKLVVGRAALVHTVDRVSLVRELARRAAALGLVQRVLLEVNLGAEEQKGGCAVEALPTLLGVVAAEPSLACTGLMCIPPSAGDPREHFVVLRALRERLRECGTLAAGAELSMGMSADFEVAIEEGATIVRVGTAIFGAREPSARQAERRP